MSRQGTNRRTGSTGRRIRHDLAILLTFLVAIPLTGMAAAQASPDDDIVLVNAVREVVERKKEGGFIACPRGIHAPRNEALDTASCHATLTKESWVPACEEA